MASHNKSNKRHQHGRPGRLQLNVDISSSSRVPQDRKWKTPRNRAGIISSRAPQIAPKFNEVARINNAINRNEVSVDMYRALLLNKKKPAKNRQAASKAFKTTEPAAASSAAPRTGTRKYASANNGSQGTLVALSQRVRDLEAKCATLTDKVHEKTAANNDLVRQVQHLRAVAEGDTATADKMNRLSKENAKLKSQVEEMLSFLKQSGLEWVGFKRDSSAEHFTGEGRSLGGNAKTPPSAGPIDFTLLFEQIKKLNAMAGEGESDVVARKGAHKLQKRSRLRLAVFRDGIFLMRGPFRAFTDTRTRDFVAQICDGFYPLELEKHHPNGVVFDAHDHSDKTFEVFKSSTEGQNELRISKEKFLQRLPASVVVNNEVVAVREAMAAKVGVTTAQKAKRSVLAPSKKVSQPTTLHIRSEDGKETLVLKLDYTNTIGDVFQEIAKHRNVASVMGLVLCTTFPRKVYEDRSATLQHLGLVPQARMMLRKQHPTRPSYP